MKTLTDIINDTTKKNREYTQLLEDRLSKVKPPNRKERRLMAKQQRSKRSKK